MPDQIRFDNKVVIVTGAGRGIGRTYATEFAARGARVVVNDLGGARGGGGESEEPAREAVDEIAHNGGEAIASFEDISTEAGGAAVVESALSAFGQVDVVVNNAGIAGDAPFTGTSDEMFERFWRVHLLGHASVSRAAWPHFAAQGHGRIVNTTSGAALWGLAEQAAYSAAKGAVTALTKTLAVEGAPLGITVNAVGPAAFTRMQADVVTDEAFREVAQRTMRAELVTPAVMLLAHDSIPVTGQIFEAFSGRVGRVVSGEVPGFFDENLTPESLREHWAEAYGDDHGLLVPEEAMSSSQLFVNAAIAAKK